MPRTFGIAFFVSLIIISVGARLTYGEGWEQLNDTKLSSPGLCPSPSPGGSCSGVVRAWSGGIADTRRNRLLLWGGGHTDYYGNELYSISLTTNPPTITRLNNPSPPASGTGCPTTLSDGAPNSRHTYGGLAYIAHADRMFVYGGGPANESGCMTNDTWTLDLANLTWTRMDPHGGPNLAAWPGAVADYDSNSRKVYINDTYMFYSYDFDTNTYALLNSNAGIDYHMNAVVDPKRKLFFMIGGYGSSGGGIKVISIAAGSTYAMTNWSSQTSGCDVLVRSDSPGLDYDPILDKIVGWPNSGNTVYLLNPDTKTCTAQTYSGGPPTPGFGSGTFGRFRYFPALNAHAVVSDWDTDAYILTLTNPPPPPPSPSAPTRLRRIY